MGKDGIAWETAELEPLGSFSDRGQHLHRHIEVAVNVVNHELLQKLGWSHQTPAQ